MRRSPSSSLVNAYLAHKQRLIPASRHVDVVQVTRDIVALHATAPTGPYLSLWARTLDFQRQALENALYEQRTLARWLCMRRTLHVVPSDELPLFVQAYTERHATSVEREGRDLLVRTGLSTAERAGVQLRALQQDILSVLSAKGPCTVPELIHAIPDLQTQIHHSLGKSYAGTFSLGSRLVPAMCTLGMLVRARPHGTWRSNLYEYAAPADWLPGIDLEAMEPQAARAELVRRYLAAFGPAKAEDVQWWTGFTVEEVEESQSAIQPSPVELHIEGMDGAYLVLPDQGHQLWSCSPPGIPYVAFLPSLDPYIMGYRDRRRFLAPEHEKKVFDRAGNAMPTVWVNGGVVGAWGQHKDGRVAYGLFESIHDTERALLDDEACRLSDFLNGEYLRPRSHTAFTRTLA
jgi:hypothetical protein